MRRNSRLVKASRRSEIGPFMVMDVMNAAAAREAEGASVMHLEVGQPGTPAPRLAREALKQALDTPLGYTLAVGLPALRARIAQLYADWYGVSLDPDRVIVTAGSSAAFQLAFLTAFDVGDRVALGDPGYPSYRNILQAYGLEPVRLQTTLETRYQPTAAQLAEIGTVQGLLAASPANPTGTILDLPAMQALVEAIEAQDGIFISDEIYHGLHFGERAVCALEVTDRAIVINSFSKYFSMTGWRIGWMVVPPELVRTVERLAQNLFICAPHASQIAALAALDATEELEENRQVYARNREVLLEAVRAAGFRDIAPCDGAFYVYASLPEGAPDSAAFCQALLAQAGVAATPGLDFDPERGAGTVRFSFARGADEISEAAARLVAWSAKQAADQ
ncbi:MAG: aminotransferase class I/II-fold pyridoxal phosphate-dependent enzyme [Neomegalonema sp.]|nr:aminotransferase class I/II-fold pyridoxal phosphate-dependent enzyme [Neomegalonema sp.]